MNVFYVSDLHLRSHKDPVAIHFMDFLKSMPQRGDILILGGDIFDLFVGNKRVFRKHFSKIVAAIRELDSRGCCVFYLEGNHDFHLKKIFHHQRNIQVREDDFEIRLGGTAFWISHGDQIDREDTGYLFLRSVTRSNLFRAVMGMIPDRFFDSLGRWSSRMSRRYTSGLKLKSGASDRIRDLYRDFAKKKIQAGYDFVLIGHSHLADHSNISAKNKNGQYLNLGFSDTHLLYAHFNDQTNSLVPKRYPD